MRKYIIETKENMAPKGKGGGRIASSLGLFSLLAKLTVKTGVYMKNIMPFPAFQRSPLMFIFPHGRLLVTFSISHRKQKKETFCLAPEQKKYISKTSSFLRPLILMSDSCSAFISLPSMLSFDYPSINETSFRTSGLS